MASSLEPDQKKQGRSSPSSPCNNATTLTQSVLPLHDDLFHLILDRLSLISTIRFRAVSRDFLRVEETNIPASPRNMHGFPWIIPTHNQNPVLYCCTNPNSSPRGQLQDQIEVMQVNTEADKDYECVGSSHGWLAFLSKSQSWSIFLLDPVSGTRFRLPDLPSSETLTKVTKVIMSSSPPSSGGNTTNGIDVVVAIESKEYSYIYSAIYMVRLGVDKQWTIFHDGTNYIRYKDIIFHKNQLYAITFSYLNVVEIKSSTNLVQEQRAAETVNTHSFPSVLLSSQPSHNYLAEVNGDLLLVSIFTTSTDMYSTNLSVHRLVKTSTWGWADVILDTYSWVEVHSLDGGALFLGGNQSIYLSSATTSDTNMKNCIYFFWNRYMSAEYVFEFNMELQKVMRLTKEILPRFYKPIWFAPIKE